MPSSSTSPKTDFKSNAVKFSFIKSHAALSHVVKSPAVKFYHVQASYKGPRHQVQRRQEKPLHWFTSKGVWNTKKRSQIWRREVQPTADLYSIQICVQHRHFLAFYPR